VVMEKAAGIEPPGGMGIRQQLDRELERMKHEKGVKLDTELEADDLERLIETYRRKIKEVLGQPFPEDPVKQLWGGIGAVFRSWNGKRAIEYRRIEKIPDEWGTAVNVQAMVFGNMGDSSGTGVGFTRDPATGRAIFYGEWLPNAQGEDVVAGTRTPLPINEAGKTDHTRRLPSLETAMPAVYRELEKYVRRLERHYRDMLDIEFTIQEGRLWLLQCRVGKRTGVAALKMAVDMVRERLINRKEAVLRVNPSALVQILLPMVDPAGERTAEVLGKGLPAGPGAAAGRIALTADEAVEMSRENVEAAEKARAAGDHEAARQLADDARVILVRNETSPEDVHGMHVAQAILTARGGMTSHAALVARGWGKCCIVGCEDLNIDLDAGRIRIGGRTLERGEWLTLNGTSGTVFAGKLPLMQPDLRRNPEYQELMTWADGFRRLGVRTNADTAEDAERALGFGAEGIGLFRTEHMFYGAGAAEPLAKLRKMIVAANETERRAALDDLAPHVKADIKATLAAMDGRPVTIRLLDPPLHEFIPHTDEGIEELARDLGVAPDVVRRRGEALHETNPMMGHRGVRLGISYPEVSEMQVRAIFEAAAELRKARKKPMPEIMIPVVSTAAELADQFERIRAVHDEVCRRARIDRIEHQVGTMIEVPRATLVAAEIAAHAQFFSFGTNDLTQMTFGFSRDDVGSFLPLYLRRKILPGDPFEAIDEAGVGELMRIGIERGRAAKPGLKIGICGEHGGEPESVRFCHRIGLDYVSCSPFRVPVARLAAAQAALADESRID
ncbi:MAG: pyruvate, orthophosphate dikinase, partial [Candidatus Binatota bacterium]|nr:pyruvate, orthophosphate dikinase [Candidatus Binatota bacterium]